MEQDVKAVNAQLVGARDSFNEREKKCKLERVKQRRITEPRNLSNPAVRAPDASSAIVQHTRVCTYTHGCGYFQSKHFVLFRGGP